MSKQVVMGSMSQSMLQQDCCDHCDNDCVACSGISTCSNNSTGHNSALIKTDLHFTYFINHTQTTSGYFVLYHSQITAPGFRPPIV
ncbi:MAG: hypothetical protein QM504_05675 [Pseudomonadota bacterium]